MKERCDRGDGWLKKVGVARARNGVLLFFGALIGIACVVWWVLSTGGSGFHADGKGVERAGNAPSGEATDRAPWPAEMHSAWHTGVKAEREWGASSKVANLDAAGLSALARQGRKELKEWIRRCRPGVDVRKAAAVGVQSAESVSAASVLLARSAGDGEETPVVYKVEEARELVVGVYFPDAEDGESLVAYWEGRQEGGWQRLDWGIPEATSVQTFEGEKVPGGEFYLPQGLSAGKYRLVLRRGREEMELHLVAVETVGGEEN